MATKTIQERLAEWQAQATPEQVISEFEGMGVVFEDKRCRSLEIGDKRINIITNDLEIWNGNEWTKDPALMLPETEARISQQSLQIYKLQTSLEKAWKCIELLSDTLEKMNNKNCL